MFTRALFCIIVLRSWSFLFTVSITNFFDCLCLSISRPNFIELAGDDRSGSFYAWLNTLGWGLSHVAAEGINMLATRGGTRNWNVVWCAPVVARLLATVVFWRWASIRSAQEHLGEKVLADRGGCIPGAANIDWLELIDHSRALQLKPLPLIKQMMNEAGLDGSKKIITHCQTHHRSGLSYLVGKLLGMPIAAYDGSWSEWGNRNDTPIENKTSTTP